MGLSGNVTAGPGLIPISPVGWYVFPAAREKSRIIRVIRLFCLTISQICLESPAHSVKIRYLYVDCGQYAAKKRIVFKKYSEHLGACTKSLAVKVGCRMLACNTSYVICLIVNLSTIIWLTIVLC